MDINAVIGSIKGCALSGSLFGFHHGIVTDHDVQFL